MSVPTHGRQESSSKLEGKMTENKEHQAVTSGIFYCRDSTEINGGGSLQTLSLVDSEVLRSRQQKHTAIRWHQYIDYKEFDI